ncbi:MAG: TenA family protein [Rhodospirillaceae bacterium]|nr:TenA family protein [Rhodospirillaceae bacterium]
MSPPLSDEILARHRDVWEAMQAHRFVRDIENDRLDPAVFRRYLVYEHSFVAAAITIFGHALVRAPGLAEQRWLIGVLGGLAHDQVDYFRRAFAALGMAEPDPEARLPAAVGAFRDGMLSLAAHGTFLDIVSAMFAAEWMYWTWCSRAAARPISDPMVKQWVDLHAADAFAAQARWLKYRVDAGGAGLPPAGRERAGRVFRRALELEIDFHAAPYLGA